MPFVRCCLLLVVVAASAPAARLTTLAGETVEGELVSADASAVVLRTADGPVSTPVASILNVDLASADSLAGVRYADVELVDGSLLHCSRFAIKGRQAELMVLPNLPVSVPLDAVRWYVADAHDAKNRQAWQEFLARQPGNTDILAVKRGEVINGLEGSVGPGDEQGETFEFELTGGRKAQPALAKIHGLVLSHPPQLNPPPTLCKLHDTNRNLLVLAQLNAGPNGVTVQTVSGAKLRYPRLQQLSRLDFSKDKLEFLSDLLPLTVEISSADDRFEGLRKDKNLDDGPLRLAGKGEHAKLPYDRGLVLFARTVVVFNVGGEYKDLKFVLGTDAQFGGENRARLVIDDATNGRELFTGELKSGDDPRAFTVPIQGVKQLRLTVTGSLLDFGSHVVLADAKVSK